MTTPAVLVLVFFVTTFLLLYAILFKS